MSDEAVMEVFPSVDAAIEQGRILEAWQLAEKAGVALHDWPEGDPLRQAARLASWMGASRLSRAMHWKNWRRRRDDPRCYYQALLSRTSFTTGSKLLDEVNGFLESQSGIPASEQADLFSFKARIHIRQRDFAPAEKLLDRAVELQPDDSWMRAERSSFYAAADRYEDALDEAKLAVKLAPFYRAAVARCADALIHLGKDDEALDLLTGAHRESPQASFAMEMQSIFSEREDHEQGLWCLSEVERLSPLMDDSFRKWLASRRADFHLMAGRIDDFLECADLAGEGFQKSAAANFRSETGQSGVRKRLDVSFVRQHRSTCAPATLAAIAAFWGQAHDHLAIADAICYEGTPWHKERMWAEEHGFVAREFRLTRESLHALIDRGIPFTLTTQWTTGAHLQACIGYDSRTDVVLLRDPTERHFGEMMMKGLLESHPLAGPRGMVMVPADRSGLLDGVHLPDELVYDSVYHLRRMIDTHDRFKIEAAVVQLRAVAPGHLLTWDGELSAAQALENWPRALEAVDWLLDRLPDYESLWLTKCSLLLHLRRTSDYRKELERIVARPKADAVFLSDLGELLAGDARELVMADYYLRRALMRRGGEARVYENLARCRMTERRFAEAARLRRAATCLAPTFEPYAKSYFETTRIIGRTAEGLEYLEGRTLVLGGKDHGPWITYAQALDSVHRSSEAAAVLEKAAALRPDDGMLLLRGGRLMTSWGPDFRVRGLALIDRSRGKVREPVWLKESAEVAGFLGERTTAIRHWRALLELQPKQIPAWKYLARLLAEEHGPDAAIALLDEGTARHPDFADLWALAAEWLVRTPRGPLEALDRYVELEPKSAWGFRERALRRMDLEQNDAALDDALEGRDLDPLDPSSPYVLGLVLLKLHRNQEAADEFRRAIALSADGTGAPEELMAIANDRQTAVEALGFIEAEMRRQVSTGGVVLKFQSLAWRWIDPPELLEKLREFSAERPDLWQTWSARITQALRMELNAEAKESALAMTEAFPLMPRAWLELARVHEAAGETHEAVSATSKAVDIAPAWDEAARTHAEALERAGNPGEAEAVLRKAVFYEPLHGANHGCLADLVRRRGRHDEAVDLLREATKACPFYHWGWTTLARWSGADGKKEEIIRDVEAASQQQGHHRSWWPLASDIWAELGDVGKAIAAIRKGIELAPDDVDLHDQLAARLCEDRQFDAALAACDPHPGHAAPPTNLQGRRAWILMKSGQPVQAIKEMRGLLDRQPNYRWGLAELTSWYSRRGDWKGVLEIATRWARQAPGESSAFGHIGQAEENLDHPLPAEKAYARALMLQPDYSFAGRRLLDLQMKAERFEEASQTLQRLEYYTPSIWVDCDRIELDLRAKRHPEALKRAELMLDRSDATFEVINWLDDLFDNHGAAHSWKSLLEKRLKAGNVQAPGALAVSIGHIPSDQFSNISYSRVKRQLPGTPVRIEGWRRMIELAGNLKQSSHLIKWSQKHREELAGHGVLWNQMGKALLAVGDYQRGIRWLKDWRQREQDTSANTLLWFAALNDGVCGNHPENWNAAKEARREGLRRFPVDEATPALRASLALQEAVDGEIESARILLEEFETEQASDFYQKYGLLARSVIAAADGDEENARTHLGDAASYFSTSTGKGPVNNVERACQAVASHLPWTRGSARRLRRKWNLRAPKRFALTVPEELKNKWVLIFVVIMAVNLVRGCAGV